MRDSNYSGFFKLPMEKRLEEVAEFASLTEEEKEILTSADSLDRDKADHMICLLYTSTNTVLSTP